MRRCCFWCVFSLSQLYLVTSGQGSEAEEEPSGTSNAAAGAKNRKHRISEQNFYVCPDLDDENGRWEGSRKIGGRYTLTCAPGFRVYGRHNKTAESLICPKSLQWRAQLKCENIDDCAKLKHGCGPLGVCEDLVDGYNCNCEEGYLPRKSMDGEIVCGNATVDATICGGHTCGAYGICINLQGDQNQIFENVSQTDNRNYSDVHDTNHSTGLAHHSGPSFRCECSDGFHDNGTACIRRDCGPQPATLGKWFGNTTFGGAYRLECQEGSFIYGKLTEFTISCSKKGTWLEYPRCIDERAEAMDAAFGTLRFWTFAALSLVCVICAAIAAGLTLGVATLEPFQLNVILGTKRKECRSSEEKQNLFHEQKSAKTLRSIVKGDHNLMVTLMLFNTLANEALPIFLDEISPAIVSVLLSVSVVLIFGEILPSAVFTGRHQHALAARCQPLVLFLQWVLSPVVWPVASLLDKCVPDETNFKYDKPELQGLIKLHSPSHNEDFIPSEEQKQGENAGYVYKTDGPDGAGYYKVPTVCYTDPAGDRIEFGIDDGRLIKYVNGNKMVVNDDKSGVVKSLRYTNGDADSDSDTGRKEDEEQQWCPVQCCHVQLGARERQTSARLRSEKEEEEQRRRKEDKIEFVVEGGRVFQKIRDDYDGKIKKHADPNGGCIRDQHNLRHEAFPWQQIANLNALLQEVDQEHTVSHNLPEAHFAKGDRVKACEDIGGVRKGYRGTILSVSEASTSSRDPSVLKVQWDALSTPPTEVKAHRQIKSLKRVPGWLPGDENPEFFPLETKLICEICSLEYVSRKEMKDFKIMSDYPNECLWAWNDESPKDIIARIGQCISAGRFSTAPEVVLVLARSDYPDAARAGEAPRPLHAQDVKGLLRTRDLCSIGDDHLDHHLLSEALCVEVHEDREGCIPLLEVLGKLRRSASMPATREVPTMKSHEEEDGRQTSHESRRRNKMKRKAIGVQQKRFAIVVDRSGGDVTGVVSQSKILDFLFRDPEAEQPSILGSPASRNSPRGYEQPPIARAPSSIDGVGQQRKQTFWTSKHCQLNRKTVTRTFSASNQTVRKDSTPHHAAGEDYVRIDGEASS